MAYDIIYNSFDGTNQNFVNNANPGQTHQRVALDLGLYYVSPVHMVSTHFILYPAK